MSKDNNKEYNLDRTSYPNSMIMHTVINLYNKVKGIGEDINNTKELINASIELHYDDNLDQLFTEEESVIKFFGKKYNKRADDERFHYLGLRYNLFHKVKEVKYFHNQGIDSRKFIVFSQDCISSIQYLVRGKKSYLICHMRSSDVLGLLPLDLHALMDMHIGLNIENNTKTDDNYLCVTIGSCHYYLDGGRDNV